MLNRNTFALLIIGSGIGALVTGAIAKKVLDDKDYQINRLRNVQLINYDLIQVLYQQAPDEIWIPEKLANDMEAFRIFDSNDLA